MLPEQWREKLEDSSGPKSLEEILLHDRVRELRSQDSVNVQYSFSNLSNKKDLVFLTIRMDL